MELFLFMMVTFSSPFLVHPITNSFILQGRGHNKAEKLEDEGRKVQEQNAECPKLSFYPGT